MSNINPDNPIFQFLAGSFHQDIDSPEEALQDLLEEESSEYLKDAIDFLTEFINSDYTDAEKNDYIQSCADGIYFPALGISPLQWLNNVTGEIRKKVQSE
ncbi:contact-dependent growth inhibition system immunity protein [Bacillus sp. Bos-x628]|uniref:contact-dependent growth inhibition system immunity protein n=1 Tax=Bacillus maqinnsis TaxID=3229854 RepID=UPI00338D73EC